MKSASYIEKRSTDVSQFYKLFNTEVSQNNFVKKFYRESKL